MTPVDILIGLAEQGHPPILTSRQASQLLAAYGIRRNVHNNPKHPIPLADVAEDLAANLKTGA